MNITGHTILVGILGHPVEHTLSPAMHNAAFASMKLDYRYLPFSVRPGDLGAALAGLRAIGCGGLNITIPHKQDVLSHLNGLTREARLIGAVNTIEFRGPRMIGHNTDGLGYVRAFKSEFGMALRGRNVLLLGAGGAARAVAVQLLIEKVGALTIANRTAGKAESLIRHLRQKFSGCRTASIGLRGDALGPAMADVDIVINATSLGLKRGDGSPLPAPLLKRNLIVSDLIYKPAETRLIREARKKGARTQNGLGMLLHQGALAFAIWTGREADLKVMKRALLQVVSE